MPRRVKKWVGIWPKPCFKKKMEGRGVKWSTSKTRKAPVNLKLSYLIAETVRYNVGNVTTNKTVLIL